MCSDLVVPDTAAASETTRWYQSAQHDGHPTPYGLCDDLQDCVGERFGRPDGVLMYSGTAGRTGNCRA